MKAGWAIKSLRDLCTFKPPKSEAKAKLCATDKVSFASMDVLGIDRMYLESSDARSFSEVAGSYTYFADGDVLLAKITPCFENGKLGIARNLVNGIGFGSSEYFVIRPNSELTATYLYYFLLQPSFREEGAKSMTGAVGHKRVSKEFLESHNIPVPPVAEQRRIVAILDEAFDGLSTAKANAEKNLQNARALFESHLQAVFTQRSEGWVEKKLGDTSILKIIDGDRGSNYPSKEDFSDEGFCLFINTKNVRPDGFNFDTTMFISEEKDKVLRKGKLQRQDVILTTRGTIGNVAIFDEDVEFENIRINSGMLIFRPNTGKILPSFLFEVFRSGIMKSQMTRHVSGAAQPQLPIKTLINFKIPVPNKLESQRAIVASVREIDSETHRLESIYQRKLTALDALKKSLLHQAFSGEL
ncbi:Restriction endonuclease subunit S [Candidatus Nitrotoga sp. BS]|uniref:restriction endonuclease subunit S n=1 Tax=Candidatus Nitrotoga sp. BS TaxID=2890408 RepID=UPI001EF2068C|nr:restriction endonuclease subunit S [Candidatus Nitrotoga sp. BS]CAH1203259.1 Restriction endonuclease subunit S [Candidatus Nitrotoga sp. BS]